MQNEKELIRLRPAALHACARRELPEPGARARNFACGANYLGPGPGWFNFACDAKYPHKALKGGFFVFVWRVVGTRLDLTVLVCL